MWCVTCSTLKREKPGRLNNCEAVPHRLAGWGGREERFGVKMQHTEYICGISRMEDWFQGNGDGIHPLMPGCSSNKSIPCFYYSIDCKSCSDEVKNKTPNITFFVSRRDVLYCPLVLIAVWFLAVKTDLFKISKVYWLTPSVVVHFGLIRFSLSSYGFSHSGVTPSVTFHFIHTVHVSAWHWGGWRCHLPPT